MERPSWQVLESLLTVSWREGPKPLGGRGFFGALMPATWSWEASSGVKSGQSNVYQHIISWEVFFVFFFLYGAGLLNVGCSSSPLTSCFRTSTGGRQNHLWRAYISASYLLATWKPQSFPAKTEFNITRDCGRAQKLFPIVHCYFLQQRAHVSEQAECLHQHLLSFQHHPSQPYPFSLKIQEETCSIFFFFKCSLL